MIGVVIVNYRTPDLAVASVRSLVTEHERLPGMTVVVVDGGSGDDSEVRLREGLADLIGQGWVSVLPLAINGGFGWANNQAMLQLLEGPSPPEYIYLLNPDTQIEPGAACELLEALHADPRRAAAGSLLLEPDGTPAGSAFSFPTLRAEFARGARTGIIERLLQVPPAALGDLTATTEVDWVTGASVLLRTAALRQVGLFDHGFFLYHEEVELMWRLRSAGWTIVHVPSSRVRHVGGAATGVHSRPVELAIAPPRPAYWYQSRQRFFALARGAAAARAVPFAWLSGHLLWRLRRMLGLKAGVPVSREVRDHVAHMMLGKRSPGAAVARPGEPPPAAPAWMAER